MTTAKALWKIQSRRKEVKMSQVILGIIGVIIFIVSAVAGVSFLGPAFTQSTTDSEAGSALQGLAQITMALSLRNAELEVVSPAGFNLDSLSPNYLPEPVSNALGARQPMLVSSAGDLTGRGALVIMILDGPKAEVLCSSISRQGGGENSAPSFSPSDADRPIGCFQSDVDVGAHISSGDFVAYSLVA